MSRAPFVLEVGTEELPAGFLAPALAFLRERIREHLEKEGLEPGEVAAAGTPRRLIVRTESLRTRQEDRLEEHIGPPVAVAFQEGKPTRAAEEFAARFRVAPAELGRAVQVRRGKEVECVAFRAPREGLPATEVLAAALPGILASVPSRKSMRWAAHGAVFPRPVRWILALVGADVVPFSFAGVESGRTTRGHRFHAPGPLEVAAAAEHAEVLARAEVEADPEKRKWTILREGGRLASSVGGAMEADDDLLEEVVHLVEKPFPVLGTFDASFLELPPEVLTTVMKVHQRYFPVVDAQERPLRHFVMVAGTRVEDPAVVAAGAARVVAARFWDARFLYEEDRRRTLDRHAEALAQLTFMEKLGSMAEKTGRIRALAGWLCGTLGLPRGEREAADRAAALCKADLTTRMVFEFPELAGFMGRRYALHAGESEAVADAIAGHVLPRGARDRLPETLPGALVGLADRMDTLCGILGTGEGVTGARDRFGLRRAALGILRILEGFSGKGLPVPLAGFVEQGVEAVAGLVGMKPAVLRAQVLLFFQERLRAWLAEDLPGDVGNAVLAAGFDDVRGTILRARALGRLVGAEEARAEDSPFRSLSVASKRVHNILRQAVEKGFLEAGEAGLPAAVDEGLLEDPVEKGLVEALGRAERAAEEALREGDHEKALLCLASLRPAVDAFFGEDRTTGVMVMVADNPPLRANRLRLLARLRRLVLRQADLSLLSR